MFKLISADFPATAQPVAAQSSTPLIRLWVGESRAIAPIAIADYLQQYANGVGLNPIVFHAGNPLRTGIYCTYTFPVPVFEVFIEGFNKVTDPRLSTPDSYWLNDRVLNVCKTLRAAEIQLDAVLSAVALSTATSNHYRIDTSEWGVFTVPTNIFVDGIELLQSDSLAPSTFKVVAGAIDIYTSAPLPVGNAIVHIHQNVPSAPKAVVATYALPSFAHVSDLAGRVYFRALEYLAPEVYEFISDDEQVISLFAPMSLFAGLAINPQVEVSYAIVKDITKITF